MTVPSRPGLRWARVGSKQFRTFRAAGRPKLALMPYSLTSVEKPHPERKAVIRTGDEVDVEDADLQTREVETELVL